MTMSKVIRSISNEDNIGFEDILSFLTKNFVGIWDYEEEEYVLLPRMNHGELYISHIPSCSDLGELDSEVSKVCGEHILEVFDDNDYELNLIRRKSD